MACLDSYNNGILYGRYIDATKEIHEIYKEISEMLKNSPMAGAEEWAIHDFEDFAGIRLGEYEGIETISKIANLLVEHGEVWAAAYQYYSDVDEATKAVEELYHGHWESELEYATKLFDEIYLQQIPERLAHYIDYEAFSRDLFCGDYFSVSSKGGVHVFSC